MNRRSLLAMIPLAPAAITLPMLSAASVAEAAPLDTRPSFRVSDFVLWATSEPHICPHCSVDHKVYTHGCAPAAFLRDQISESAVTRPATADAIPIDIFQGCPHNRPPGVPHQHHDFRWEDA